MIDDFLDAKPTTKTTGGTRINHQAIAGGFPCGGDYGYVAKMASGAVDSSALHVSLSECDTDMWAGSVWTDTLANGQGVIEITICLATSTAGTGMQFDVWFDRYVPCPATGDSVLDNPAVRKRLLQALDSSVAAKIEFGGYISPAPTPPSLLSSWCTS